MLVCRLIGGKITLVHRRLWPLLISVADRLAPAAIACVKQEHSAGGRHINTETPFPDWAPADALQAASQADPAEAQRIFGPWLV